MLLVGSVFVLVVLVFVLVAEADVEPVGHRAEEFVVVAGGGFGVELIPEVHLVVAA